MKRENLRLAIEVNNELKAIESLLNSDSFKNTDMPEIIRAIVGVGFMKIKPLLEERRVELQKKMEEL